MGIPDGWVIYRLGDAVAFVFPLGRHASTSPILLQRYCSIRAVPGASCTVQLHIKLWNMNKMFCAVTCTHESLVHVHI